MSYQIICPLAYFDEARRIFCNVTNTPCAHVFLCRLDCKWKQTDKAKDCPKRKENRNGE